ncbi:hypothetical protein B296_00016810, partial [Ensete ventricosum]
MVEDSSSIAAEKDTAFPQSLLVTTKVLHFVLYCPVRAVCIGPTGHRYVDCSLLGSTIEIGRQLRERSRLVSLCGEKGEQCDASYANRLLSGCTAKIDHWRLIEGEKGKKKKRKRRKKKEEEKKKEYLVPSPPAAIAARCRRRPRSRFFSRAGRKISA